VRSKVRVLRNLHACSSGNHDKGTDDEGPETTRITCTVSMGTQKYGTSFQ